MSCVKCGRLYCICDLGHALRGGLSHTEQVLLQMWEIWIDGRKDERGEDDDADPDPAPRIALQFFRDSKVSFNLLELMARWAREYGYEL